MKKILFLAILLMLGTLMFSCWGKKGSLLTERIQYDVPIKTPEVDLAWYVQNLEGPNREKFIQAVIQSAQSGKLKVYDVMSNKQLSAADVLAAGTRTELLTLQRPYEPFENFDTIVTRELQLSDITRVRFLEEWYMNEDNGRITKKVIAMCPLVESYTEEGQMRGYQPLFWMSYVKRFPLEVK
ncbi:MAG: hypothetical protein K0B15_10045 [Lentimicrobium sp.]|nr:hypothetical protein [Lentimicrobium sp.]